MDKSVDKMWITLWISFAACGYLVENPVEIVDNFILYKGGGYARQMYRGGGSVGSAIQKIHIYH